jgi:hypothetical protein
MPFPFASAITGGIDILTSLVNLIPTAADKYRAERLNQLKISSEEGFTAEQEDRLRSIGLGAAATAEREARSRQGDALAILAGGATANDILGAQARETERASNTRQKVENQVIAADLQEREARRAEMNALNSEQGAITQSRRDGVLNSVMTASDNILGAVQKAEQDKMESGKKATEGAAARQYGFSTEYTQGSKASNGGVGYGIDTDLKKNLDGLSDEEKQQLLAMLGRNNA